MINVINGDCRRIIPTLGMYDFIFADPPFNIGQQYNEFDDNIEDYEEFTNEWVDLCWNHCRGVLILYGNDDLAEDYCVLARAMGLTRIAWITWYHGFGQYQKSNFIQTKTHCLIYSKGDFTWNPDAILIDSARIAYGDDRIFQSKDLGKKVPGTVWGIPEDGQYWGRVQGNNKERRPLHPNQLPEVLLKRLILAYTNVSDNVLDPFGGSGTTAIVADSLYRNCDTIEISPISCESIRERSQIGMIRKG